MTGAVFFVRSRWVPLGGGPKVSSLTIKRQGPRRPQLSWNALSGSTVPRDHRHPAKITFGELRESGTSTCWSIAEIIAH